MLIATLIFAAVQHKYISSKTSVEIKMVNAFSKLLIGAFCGGNKKKQHNRMEDWFRVEYGKNWKHAMQHYSETGSIHWRG